MKLHFSRYIAAALLLFVIASCNKHDLPGLLVSSSDGPDKRFKQSEAYNASHSPLEIRAADENYRLYLFADVHVQNSTKNLDDIVRIFHSDRTSPVCLFLGDFISGKRGFGQIRESLKPVMESAVDTILCTPGNHDIQFGQWDEYASIFKTSCYTFAVVTPSGWKDIYICMDSASGKVGHKQMEWLRRTLYEAYGTLHRHIILFTHTNFFKTDALKQGLQGNYNMEETYDLLGLFSDCEVGVVFTGHKHRREEITYGGVRYATLDSSDDEAETAYYAIADISRSEIKINHIKL